VTNEFGVTGRLTGAPAVRPAVELLLNGMSLVVHERVVPAQPVVVTKTLGEGGAAELATWKLSALVG
jgi:hypothetical protein